MQSFAILFTRSMIKKIEKIQGFKQSTKYLNLPFIEAVVECST